MRKRKSFTPAALGNLESRIALSAFGAVSAEIAKVGHHEHGHSSKADHHEHEHGHGHETKVNYDHMLTHVK